MNNVGYYVVNITINKLKLKCVYTFFGRGKGRGGKWKG
jgi:hypothetical protein